MSPTTQFSLLLSATVHAHRSHPMISVPILRQCTQSQYNLSALSTQGNVVVIMQSLSLPLTTQQFYVPVQLQTTTIISGHVQPSMMHSTSARPTPTPAPERLIPQQLVQQISIMFIQHSYV